MNRQEQIEAAADNSPLTTDRFDYIAGAQWADEHDREEVVELARAVRSFVEFQAYDWSKAAGIARSILAKAKGE